MPAAKPPESVTLKLSCACDGSFEMTAPEPTVKTYSAAWRREHRGHEGAPHVVPSGATSGDVSLKYTPQYQVDQRMGPRLPGAPW